MEQDDFYMNLAIQEAVKAFDEEEIPIGAVIVCNDKIIAKAHNLTETLCDASAHAEMQAFTAASAFLGSKYLNDCVIYVTFEPCVMCAGAAFWTQIDKVVFGAYDVKHANINRNLLYHPKTKIVGGVLENECAALLSDFFKNKR